MIFYHIAENLTIKLWTDKSVILNKTLKQIKLFFIPVRQGWRTLLVSMLPSLSYNGAAIRNPQTLAPAPRA
jgi:hypothetical protein